MILNQSLSGLRTGLLLSLLFMLSLEKCVNSTDFKYDLKDVSEIIGYHSVCSEYSRRTCCSTGNFDFIGKK